MSNLSDLMPAGASGKTIEATATATIASKAPVILNSTGTVTEVGLTADSAGIPAVYQTNGLTWNQVAFDSSTNKVVISYNQGGTGAKAAVGTISGSTITYGTPVAISGAGNSYGSITYDSNTNRVVIAYRDYSNSDYGTAVVGAVTGTSITFGTPVVFESASTPYIGTTFDTNNNAVAISYADGGNSNYGTAVVGTVTGGGTNSISFGTPAVFNSGATAWTAATFDTSYNRVVIAYMDDTNADYGTVNLGSISGSVITFGGSEIVFGAHQTSHIAIAYDSTLEKVVIAYNNIYPDGLGTAIVGTGTGSYTMTFGTPVVFEPSGNDSFYMTATFDSNVNKVVIAYQDVANSSYGTVIVGTVSDTTISFDTAVVFEAATTTYIGCAYDSNAAKVAIVYSDGGNSDYGTGVVFSLGGTNVTSTNFVGIADAAITSDATFVVTVGGGKFVIDGVSQDTVSLQEGATYTFDQAAGTNSTHPLRFSTTSDGTHGGGSEYTTGVTTNGTPGSAGAYTRIVVADSAPTLYYYCSNHSGMGGTANTPAFSATGTVVVQGGTIAGMSSLTTGGKYYVQNDGTLTSPDATAAYAINGATYDSVSFNISQDNTPTGMCFNNDGTKMYVCGENTDTVYQYSLSSAYDLSTASYDSVSLDVSSQQGNPRGVVLNNDGSALYICGTSSAAAHQYTLSTEYDLSTASYASKTVSVASQELYPCGLIFNNDGSSMYVVGSQNDTAYQYTLSTPFDLSTASYASKSLDGGSEQSSSTGLAFNSDGTKIFIIGETPATIFQYSLSSAYDMSTGSYDSVSYSPTEASIPRDIVWGNSGNKFYVPDSATDNIFQYTPGGGASSSVNAGLALSATQLLLNGDS